MSLRYGDCNAKKSPAALAEWDPFRQSREDHALLRYRDEDGWGGKRPKKKPGDIIIMIGAAIGIVAGGIGGYYVNLFMVVVGVVAGGVVGAVTGSMISSFIIRRRNNRTRKQATFKEE